QIWVVDCAPDTQVQRVVARSGLTPAEVAQIMAQQATREQRLACADVVIYNQDLDLAGLKRLVHKKAADFGL
ncbi:dephospho-CoA kinase, partial [bacterium]|nr:dephospho-CoA kinase [bacterium]